MLDVCLLGRGGVMPIPGRALTAVAARCNGSTLLIDCGEGTQTAMRENGISFYDIDVICLTHYHADHVSGLPGLLLSMGMSGRTKPVTILGPVDLKRTVCGLRVIAPELPFPIVMNEMDPEIASVDVGPFHITAYPARHTMPCFCYSAEILRKGRFQPDKARGSGIPVRLWSRLQQGETVTVDGKTFVPEDVMGPARRGLKISNITDTRPLPSLIECARDADILIAEGMYGDDEKARDMREKGHMTMSEAAQLASDGQVKRLWMTHYSPAEREPEMYLETIGRLLPENCEADLSGTPLSLTLTFDKEE